MLDGGLGEASLRRESGGQTAALHVNRGGRHLRRELRVVVDGLPLRLILWRLWGFRVGLRLGSCRE